MASKEGQHHVLMVAFALQGHINPLLRLGNMLVARGLHVTLATTEIVHHTLFKSSDNQHTNGVNAAAPASIAGIDLLFFSDGFTLDYDRDNLGLDLYMHALGETGPKTLTTLIKDHFCSNHKKLSCLLVNPFVAWAVDVADQLKIPCACFWIQPCALFSIYYHFYNNLTPFSMENPRMDYVNLPGLPLLHEDDLPSFILPTNTFGTATKLLTKMFLNMDKLKWVLGNSFYELEKEVADSMNELTPILTVGPVVPESLLGQDRTQDVGMELWKPQNACLDWLDRKTPRSVVYISFGSIIVLTAEQKESIATALKNSKRAFLWVIKGETQNSDKATGLPSWFLEETKERGLIVPWSPQTKVLSHPAIACFITHSGWNSTLEAITAGTPMIAYPQWTDQPTNARLVVDVFRVGLRLKQNADGSVGSEEVEKAIEEIISGPRSEEIKKNAAKWKKAAVEAVEVGGSSDRNIRLFVDEILGCAST